MDKKEMILDSRIKDLVEKFPKQFQPQFTFVYFSLVQDYALKHYGDEINDAVVEILKDVDQKFMQEASFAALILMDNAIYFNTLELISGMVNGDIVLKSPTSVRYNGEDYHKKVVISK